MHRRFAVSATIGLALCAGPALSQDRPNEEEIFGTPAPGSLGPGEGQGLPPRPSEGEIFGGGPQPARAATPEILLREDPLKIGGMLYLRGVLNWWQGAPPSDWPLGSPNLLDGYFDARPNDRVRGFVLARTLFDPTIDPNAPTRYGQPPPTNPQVLLDQMWLRFDIERAVFVTAGRQHVKWGTGHFWNPTDFLHASPRDALNVFDQRTGTTMLRLHVPWERRGWNFYCVATFDNGVDANELGKVGVGGRAEAVFGTVEIGVDALLQKGRDARFGIDVSAGIWDLDVYAEAALRKGSDVTLYRLSDSTVSGVAVGTPFEPLGLRPAVTAGLSWSYKYSDEDSLTVGLELFYNANGYDDSSLYPWLLYQQGLNPGQPYFTPFYLGRRYAGAYLLLPKPGSWNDTTFTLSVLGNLSDHTYITRLDYSVLLLTYLTLEAYVAGHFGTKGGEFRFALDVPAGVLAPGSPAIQVLPAVLDLGIALRVSL